MIARSLLRMLFERVGAQSDATALRVEFADSSVYQNGPHMGREEVLVRFRSQRAEWHTLLFFYEGLFESFIASWDTAPGFPRPSPGRGCCEIH
jgi:hypothetical protein